MPETANQEVTGEAEGFFHTFSGVVVFALSLLLLMLLHSAFGWTDRFRQSRRIV